jgi:hypothetical protein
MRISTKGIAVLCIVAVAWIGFVAGTTESGIKSYHNYLEINFFRGAGVTLPLTNNDYFQGSGRCDGCHGTDPTAFANVNAEGVDISPIEMWRGSMMANSAKDPLWRAKVSHEITINPAHQSALENKCTQCHAPMGNYSNQHFNLGPYSMETLLTDSLGLDGVSCMACHKQSTVQLGNTNSGLLHFIDAPVVFGPHGKPFTSPMQEFVGLEPTESQHIRDAGICAGCHTLLTESVDLSGNLTGQTFVEQATYHEWLNSDFNDDDGDGITCQGCHMPENNDGVVLSANYSFLPQRSPVGIHSFAGANMFMLKLMRDNWQDLGLWADDVDLSRAYEAAADMLLNQTLSADLDIVDLTADTAYYTLQLHNDAGHKFPSGYPSRRAFVEFVVTDQNGNQVFASGQMDQNYNLVAENNNFERHWNVINSQDKVQIYEMVPGDVNGMFTTVLERAYQCLKDNRLAPRGFSKTHAVYDTTRIVGEAFTDADFNALPGVQNSGTDIVHFHVPITGFNGTLKAVAKVRYQTLPQKWVNDMFTYNTDPILTFRNMYNAASKEPIVVGCDSVLNVNAITGIDRIAVSKIQVSPNPVRGGNLRLSVPPDVRISGVEILDSDGRKVATYGSYTGTGLDVGGLSKGLYLVRINSDRGQVLRKVIVQD